MAKDTPLGPDPHYDYEHDILKNRPGFTDEKKLERFERKETARAVFDLQNNPIKGRFDAAHLQQIHAHIFQNVYPWAGQFRQVNMHRPASFPFANVQFMNKNLDGTLAKLSSENHLKGLDADAFSKRAAYYLGELNTIHPFREGNGRTQREFIRELAAEAGHQINWNRVTREQMYDASIESHNLNNNAPLASLVRSAIEPVRQRSKATTIPTVPQSVAIALTERQTRLILASERPTDARAFSDLREKGKTIEIMRGRADLDYDAKHKLFYATVDRADHQAVVQHFRRLEAKTQTRPAQQKTERTQRDFEHE
jgi:cell filamentation protein